MDFVRESPSAAIHILQSLVLRQLRSQIPKTHVATFHFTKYL